MSDFDRLISMQKSQSRVSDGSNRRCNRFGTQMEREGEREEKQKRFHSLILNDFIFLACFERQRCE